MISSVCLDLSPYFYKLPMAICGKSYLISMDSLNLSVNTDKQTQGDSTKRFGGVGGFPQNPPAKNLYKKHMYVYFYNVVAIKDRVLYNII